MTKNNDVANIEGLARFTKRNRRSCEIFYARREKTLGPRFCQVNTRRRHMDHQEAIRPTTANIDGIIARWNEQLLNNDM